MISFFFNFIHHWLYALGKDFFFFFFFNSAGNGRFNWSTGYAPVGKRTIVDFHFKNKKTKKQKTKQRGLLFRIDPQSKCNEACIEMKSSLYYEAGAG